MVSEKIKAILALTGKKQVELAEYFGMTKQVMNNKIRLNRWSIKDIVKFAEFTGCKLYLELPNKQTMQITEDDVKENIGE